jgi:hypothetical protein
VSEERKRAILDHALRDPELLAVVPPVVALSFGVLPVRKLGSVLTVACFPQANRDALRLLRDVLSLEIVALPVEERPLQSALQKAYHGADERSPNFPTFKMPDFLTQDGAATALRREKVEDVGETGSTLAADTLVLASWTYESCLWNLDHPQMGAALPDPRVTKYELRDDELAWTLGSGGIPTAWVRTPPLPREAILLANEFKLSDHRHVAPGALFAEHRVLGSCVTASELPYVIHPTEVQLARVERGGALAFHAYDREERIEPGEARAFACEYHFLSFGNRLRREIRVSVHEVLIAERAKLAVRSGKPPWTARDLERWFSSPPSRPTLDGSAS